jgi:transposase
MLSKKGKIEFSYNPQITTEKNGFIIANDVSNDPIDVKQLKPQVIQTKTNLKEIPKDCKWSFDKGYLEGSNINFLNKHNIDAYIPYQKEPEKKLFSKSKFEYDKENDVYICPENKILTFRCETFGKSRNKKIKLYKTNSCNSCKNQKKCTNRKDGIRIIKKYEYEEDMKFMKEKMKTENAKEIYKERKQIVEVVFGDFKENKGIMSFLTKSLETVQTEFNLMSIANNLSKIRKFNLNKTIERMSLSLNI